MADFVHLHVHSEYSLLDGAAQLDDWPGDLTRDEQVAYITRQVARLVDADGMPLIACLIRLEQPVYKRVDAFTAADAAFIYNAMREAQPVSVMYGYAADEFVTHWKRGGVTQLTTETLGHPSLVMPTREASAALTRWAVRRGYLAKTEAQTDLRRLGVTGDAYNQARLRQRSARRLASVARLMVVQCFSV